MTQSSTPEPQFLTAWEREDYERQKRGEPPRGPAGASEPFGRQPQPVRITMTGEAMDVAYWKQRLMRAAEFKGDMTQNQGLDTFVIYPRAVND